MSTQRIPESYTHHCDRCGHTEPSKWKDRPGGWSHYVAPFNENGMASPRLDLCIACSTVVCAVAFDRAAIGGAA